MKKYYRVVGECEYCKDPIYDFQKVRNEMHNGCARIKDNEDKEVQ